MKIQTCIAMVTLLVLSLAAPDAYSRNKKPNTTNKSPNTGAKKSENATWKVQTVAPGTTGSITLTLSANAEVKEVKVSHMTEVVIDGATKKTEDITQGMTVLSFVIEGEDLPLSRIVLESSTSKGKTDGGTKKTSKGK